MTTLVKKFHTEFVPGQAGAPAFAGVPAFPGSPERTWVETVEYWDWVPAGAPGCNDSLPRPAVTGPVYVYVKDTTALTDWRYPEGYVVIFAPRRYGEYD